MLYASRGKFQCLPRILSSSKREYFFCDQKSHVVLSICSILIRPELVTDSAKDYAVAAVDPYESSMQPSAPYSAPASNPTSHQVPSGGQGLMEGKGMLSWNLAEKREGTTWVCGRVAKDPAGSRRVRRKLNTTGSNMYDMEDPEADNDDEITETLEVWLQLVEVSVSLR